MTRESKSKISAKEQQVNFVLIQLIDDTLQTPSGFRMGICGKCYSVSVHCCGDIRFSPKLLNEYIGEKS